MYDLYQKMEKGSEKKQKTDKQGFLKLNKEIDVLLV